MPCGISKLLSLGLVFPQSVIMEFLLNLFSYVVNILFSKLFQESPGKISALGLSCTDLAALDPHSQDLRSIFFQRAAWLIRFIKNH